MAKSHIGPNGPGRCRAKKAGTCPYVPDAGHFDTVEQANAEMERRAARFSNKVSMLEKRRVLTVREKNQLAKNKALLSQISKTRVKRNPDIVVDGEGAKKANPERLRERAMNVQEFAQSHGNLSLQRSASKAKVLPIGSFKDKSSNGRKRFAASTAIATSLQANAYNERDSHFRNSLSKWVRENEDKIDWSTVGDKGVIVKNTGQLPDDVSSVSTKVERGFSASAFEKHVPEAWKKELLVEKERNSAAKLKEALGADANKYITRTSSAFVVAEMDGDAKAYRDGYDSKGTYSALDKASEKGKVSVSDLAEVTASGIGSNLRDYQDKFGESPKETSQRASDQRGFIRAIAEKKEYGHNVIVPGKETNQNMLIRGEERVNWKQVEADLGPEKMAQFKETYMDYDHERAKVNLDPAISDKVYNVPQVKVRVNMKRK